MAANVFRVIIPNQKKIAAALMAGERPDPALGLQGRQRSIHNNYLTLPVLLMMVSNHYPLLTGQTHGWLLVALILVIGGMVRHILNRHEAGDPFRKYWWALPGAAVALALAVIAGSGLAVRFQSTPSVSRGRCQGSEKNRRTFLVSIHALRFQRAMRG